MTGSKRKRQHRPSGSQQHRASSNHTSHPDSKRRRLSNELNEDMRSTQNGPRNGHDRGQDDDGWTKVVSKNSKSKKSDQQSHGGHGRDDYPVLRFYKNYSGIIRTSDLRDLALYLLADGVSPNWIGIGNSRYVSKVVTILVPGLDEKLFRRAENLLKEKHKLSAVEQVSAEEIEEIAKPVTESPANGNPEATTGTEQAPAADSAPSTSQESHSWLFENVLQVKAPGDSKANRVHSPLQALLLAPEPQTKKDPWSRQGPSQSTLTPITEFIHDADELREADFPVHPAAFTTKADGELEALRREKTGQSTSAGWVDTNVTVSQVQTDETSKNSITRGTSIYSIDCEMVQTSDDVNSLARVSMISYPDGKVVIDKYVKPDLPITNYFTQYSGITPEILENVTTTLQDVQKELLDILTSSSILLGHSLDSDLNALKLTHPFLVDTSLIYPHPRGLPLRSSLKYLANKYLKREIQIAGANGHNSVEDAQAVLDLVKLKCEKGPKWGTMEANGEAIFKRLKRSGRTSAMVEFGTPERGFGKDATHTIGCQDDDEIVKGIIRAVKGDSFFDFEIPAGGVDFVWGRLRALEYARGWVSGAASAFQQTKKDSVEESNDKDVKEEDAKQSNANSPGEDDEVQKLDTLARETVDRLQQIYNALPEKALLILASGTGDVRPVMRLQAQQQQYRKEFKVKKWDDLTVQWTDTEEQALRRACEDARGGWGVCAIK